MISRVYDAGLLKLHHFDFYRLTEPGVVLNELTEVIKDSQNVVAIEWSDIIADALPENKTIIRFDKMASGANDRRITVTYPDFQSYLLEKDLPE